MRTLFEGTDGVLAYADGRTVLCKYRLWADELRSPKLECRHYQPHWVSGEDSAGGARPTCFKAVDAGGLSLRLEGVFVQTTDDKEMSAEPEGVLVTYVCDGPGLKILTDNKHEPVSVAFRLLNLRFTGDPVRYDLPSGGYGIERDQLELNLDGWPVRLIRLPRYSAIVHRLISGDVDASATCEAVCASEPDTGSLEDRMDLLCSILSLAAGTKVTWISYSSNDSAGHAAAMVRRGSVIKKFSAGNLIDLDDAFSLKTFVETAFGAVDETSDALEVRRVIDAKIDTRSGGFLETRSLMASVLAEYLVKSHSARRHHRARSFKEHAVFAVKDLQLPFRGKDLRKVVATRDSLVHELRFRSSDRNRELRAVLHFVDTLLLRRVKYSGPYVNCLTWTQDSLAPLESPPQKASRYAE